MRYAALCPNFRSGCFLVVLERTLASSGQAQQFIKCGFWDRIHHLFSLLSFLLSKIGVRAHCIIGTVFSQCLDKHGGLLEKR